MAKHYLSRANRPGGDSVVVYSYLVVATNLCVYVGSLLCGVVLGDSSSLSIILIRKRPLAPLLRLWCGCLWLVYLPNDAMGWSASFYCDIFWSFSLNLQAVDLIEL